MVAPADLPGKHTGGPADHPLGEPKAPPVHLSLEQRYQSDHSHNAQDLQEPVHAGAPPVWASQSPAAPAEQ